MQPLVYLKCSRSHTISHNIDATQFVFILIDCEVMIGNDLSMFTTVAFGPQMFPICAWLDPWMWNLQETLVTALSPSWGAAGMTDWQGLIF